jgi:L-fuconate dehydratase
VRVIGWRVKQPVGRVPLYGCDRKRSFRAQVCQAIHNVADRIVGKKVEDLFAYMGKTWTHLTQDSLLRWYGTTAPTPMLETVIVIVRIGPEKGVIHIATAAVGNAVWDMYARSRSKLLWKLIVDMTPVRSL